MQTRTPAKVLSWKSEQPAAVGVLCLHGIESHSGWFEDLGRALCARGIDCHAYDRSGSGENRHASAADDSEEAHLQQLLGIYSDLRPRYRYLIILGMSWGGLLAAFFVAKSAGRPDRTLLLAPGIFPARQLPSLSLLRAAFGLALRPEMPIALPYQPEDFSGDLKVVQRIKSDALRRTRVSARLLGATLSMQRFVRSAVFDASAVEVWLPESDAIIDLARTRSFAAARRMAVREFKGHSHCLVLECPSELADAVQALAAKVVPV